MNLHRMKVASRLALGFGILLALLGVIGGLGLYGMNEMRRSLVDITEVNAVQKQLADDMYMSVQVRAINLRSVALFTDPTLVKTEYDRYVESGKRYQDATARLAQMFRDDAQTIPEEHALLAEAQRMAQDTMPYADQVMRLMMDGRVEEGAALLGKEVRPRQLTWLAQLEKLSDLEAKLSAETADAAQVTGAGLSVTIGIAAGLALLLGVLAAVLITRSILRQLGGEPAEAQRVAGEIASGNLAVRLAVPAGDDASLMASLEAMRRQLGSIVHGIRESAESISSAAEQIAQGNTDLSQRTEEQAASLEETAASMEELTSTVRQNNESARQGSELAATSATQVRQTGELVSQVVASMNAIQDSSGKINDIISVIESIAFQTNILALNAAVEAARAGEQGRGFAVVASEVRALAQRSATAAKEVREIIERSSGIIQDGTRLASRTGENMGDVVKAVSAMADINGEIANASGEQTQGIEQVGVAVAQMDSVTQQNAALVEEASAAAQALAEQSRYLLRAISIFKVDGEPLRVAVEQAERGAGMPRLLTA
jgi:methyl-accepting chemotaxis protein